MIKKPISFSTVLLLLAICSFMFSSCSTQYLNVSGIAYQSIRSKGPITNVNDVPQDAEIIVSHIIDKNGMIDVTVKNNTDKIMIIDRTKSLVSLKIV